MCDVCAEKPSFRAAFRHRRCLVPADGFYEWRREDDIRQPFRIGMKGGGAFAFAGLWESWSGGGDGQTIETFAILTTDANRKLRPIHPRMPVILAPESFAAWLDTRPEAAEPAVSLLHPYSDEPMAFYRVSTRVNSPRNDDPACIEPLSKQD